MVKYMANWENIKKKVGIFAAKTAKKTAEFTDVAALKIKIAAKEADIDLAYRRLGKLSYAKLKELEGVDPAELTTGISDEIKEIDKLLAELEALKKEDAERKAAKKAAKAEEDEDEEDEELDTAIIEEFKEARVVADKAYVEAKKAAEEAREEE